MLVSLQVGIAIDGTFQCNWWGQHWDVNVYTCIVYSLLSWIYESWLGSIKKKTKNIFKGIIMQIKGVITQMKGVIMQNK